MTDDLDELIRFRMMRARETLKDATILHEQHQEFSTVNRIYYSMFYTVLALLARKGLSSSKHSGVRALFNREFIKTGLVSREYGEFYRLMYEKREKSDYEDFVSFEAEDVKNWLIEAHDFIDSLNALISPAP